MSRTGPGFRVVLLSLTLSIVLAAPSPAHAQKPIVAVFNIEDKGAGISAEVLNRLSNYLSASLAATGAYQVVPRDQLKQRLVEQKKKSYRECYDQTCQIEIGRELAAQMSLSTQIMKLGARCTVTAVLYDLRKAASEGGASAEGDCSEEGVVASIKSVLTKLVGQGRAGTGQAAVLRGGLLVKSTPEGAQVWLDGVKRQGSTPLTLSNLAAGDHLLVLKKNDKRLTAMVRVIADQFTTVSVALRQAGVRLEVLSDPPEAEILLDGQPVGRTPKILSAVDAGKHTLELRKPGYLPAREQVRLAAQTGKRSLNVALQRAGSLVVRSEPSGATLVMDGDRVGWTPKKVELAPGRHLVRLALASHDPVSRQVEVTAGEQTVVTLILELSAAERQRLRAARDEQARLVAKRRSKSIWAYTTLASGLALAAGAGVFYGLGFTQGSEAHDSYNAVQSFDQAALDQHRGDVESSRTKLVAGNVLIGAAAVSLGFSLYQFFSRPEVQEQPRPDASLSSVSVSPAARGAVLSFGGRY